MDPQKVELVRIATQFLASLVWPGVVLVFICKFQRAISNFIDRLRKVGGSYFEATTGDLPQQQEDKPANLSDLEQLIPKELIAHQTEVTKKEFAPYVGQGKEREEALFKIVASFAVAIRYHRLDASLFGSQLALLLELNSKTAGIAPHEARPFYDRAVEQYPATYTSYSFDQWLGFMTSHELIENKNGVLRITLFGKGLINFLLKIHASFNRVN